MVSFRNHYNRRTVPIAIALRLRVIAVAFFFDDHLRCGRCCGRRRHGRGSLLTAAERQKHASQSQCGERCVNVLLHAICLAVAWPFLRGNPSGLIPLKLVLFAPLNRNLSQRLISERVPVLFDLQPPNGVLEDPKGSSSVNCAQQLLPHPVLDLTSFENSSHDGPFVNLELGREPPESAAERDSFRKLQLLVFYQLGIVRFFFFSGSSASRKRSRDTVSTLPVSRSTNEGNSSIGISSALDNILEQNLDGHVGKNASAIYIY